jgi:hypothetical protein
MGGSTGLQERRDVEIRERTGNGSRAEARCSADDDEAATVRDPAYRMSWRLCRCGEPFPAEIACQ